MPVYRLGLIVALYREARSIYPDAWITSEPIPIGSNHLLMLYGIGQERAKLASKTLIEAGCEHLISWGCCAGLVPNLVCGDIIIPNSISDTPSSTMINLHIPNIEIHKL